MATTPDYYLGRTYFLFRGGTFIGTATWVDDPNHGRCFRKEEGDEYVIYMDYDEAYAYGWDGGVASKIRNWL